MSSQVIRVLRSSTAPLARISESKLRAHHTFSLFCSELCSPSFQIWHSDVERSTSG